MKRTCFLPVLIFFYAASAQKLPWAGTDSAYVQVVNLPGITQEKLIQPYIYMFSDNDVYNLFGYDSGNVYRNFDFTNYHIFGIYTCRQCLLHCDHVPGDHTSCHRNSCSYGWMWLKRDNKKAFTFLPSMSLRTKDRDFHYDTIVKPVSPADSGKAVWYIHLGGDCHARHMIKLYTDNFYPLVAMKVHNYYGGCRAGRLWQFKVRFTPPEGDRKYLHNTILEERWDKNEKQ